MVDALSSTSPISDKNLHSLQSSPSTSDQNFADLLAQAEHNNNPTQSNTSQLEKAAKRMEIQLVTLMFKTMEKSGSEGGLLGGSKSEGLSHFKDLFFQTVAEDMVKHRGLGLAEAIVNTSKSSNLAT